MCNQYERYMHKLFTNNRAELKAILCAIEQVSKLSTFKLLLYFESQNYINVLNSLHASQLKEIPIDKLPSYTGSNTT